MEKHLFTYTKDPGGGLLDYHNFNLRTEPFDQRITSVHPPLKGDCDDVATLTETFARASGRFKWVRKYFIKKHDTSLFGHVICIAKANTECEQYVHFDWHVDCRRNHDRYQEYEAAGSIAEIVELYESRDACKYTFIPIYFNQQNRFRAIFGVGAVVIFGYRAVAGLNTVLRPLPRQPLEDNS